MLFICAAVKPAMKLLSKKPETVKLLFPLVMTGVLSELAFTPFIDVAKEDLYSIVRVAGAVISSSATATV